MIPKHVITLFQQPPMMSSSSRDDQLQPYILRVFGAVIHPDLTTITFFVPQKRSERMIANLENNGRIALTAVSPVTFETYQLKGSMISWRPSNEADHQAQDIYLAQVKERLSEAGFPKEAHDWNFWHSKPSLVITFRVESVFGQTPGPGTGNEISE